MKLVDETHEPLPPLPQREANSHKGDYGHALLIGGSRGMSGAISLAGRAALRSGAGLVTLAVPRDVQNVVATFEPSYMTHGLADVDGRVTAEAANEVIALAQQASVVAIGPGLGRAPEVTEFVGRLYREIEKPIVVDADGLFAFAESFGALSEPGGPRVLTPHPGEFARFRREMPADDNRVAAAAELAGRDSSKRTIVLLKGHRTVVTDGQRFSLNETGNPGMATAGAGDVLTGIITGFMCQGMEPFDAARLGAYLHGNAGDMACETLGQVSLIATDIIDYLPHAVQFFYLHQRGVETNFRR